MERGLRQEIKRRTIKVKVFPNEAAFKRLVTAVFVEIDVKRQSAEKPYFTWRAAAD